MAEKTNIEWCDATVNWWAGCTQVSPACDNCYAKRMAGRLWGTQWGPSEFRHRFNGAAATLRALDRKAQRLGKPLTVFHNSLSDMFDPQVPDAWRMDAFEAMADTRHLIHLVLTKLIGNVRHYTQRDSLAFDLIGDGRVRLGITVCNQDEADRDIPKLLHVPAAFRFLSCEPLLGPLQLWRLKTLDFEESPEGAEVYPLRGIYAVEDCDWTAPKLDWVIVGGESGPGARPMHPDWARSLRDQCTAAGVPFLFKQWGEWTEVDTGMPQPLVAHFGDPEFYDAALEHDAFLSSDGHFVTNPDSMNDDVPYRGLVRVGKKAAGRLLDGVEHNGRPA